MEMSVSRQGNATIVSMVGNFDIGSADAFYQFATDLLEEGSTPRMALDFTEVDFIASTGLRALLRLAQRIQQMEGLLRVYGANETVGEVFTITGFTEILTIVPGQEAAMEDLA
jgi:anti-anti-sigma factor